MRAQWVISRIRCSPNQPWRLKFKLHNELAHNPDPGYFSRRNTGVQIGWLNFNWEKKARFTCSLKITTNGAEQLIDRISSLPWCSHSPTRFYNTSNPELACFTIGQDQKFAFANEVRVLDKSSKHSVKSSILTKATTKRRSNKCFKEAHSKSIDSCIYDKMDWYRRHPILEWWTIEFNKADGMNLRLSVCKSNALDFRELKLHGAFTNQRIWLVHYQWVYIPSNQIRTTLETGNQTLNGPKKEPKWNWIGRNLLSRFPGALNQRQDPVEPLPG